MRCRKAAIIFLRAHPNEIHTSYQRTPVSQMKNLKQITASYETPLLIVCASFASNPGLEQLNRVFML